MPTERRTVVASRASSERPLIYHRYFKKLGHDLVGKKHSRPREPQKAPIIDQDTGFAERFQTRTVNPPHVDVISGIYCMDVDATGQAEAREKRFLERLARREVTAVRTELASGRDSVDVLCRG